MSKTLTLKPRLSEKTYALSQVGGVYVFNVPKNSSKQQIAQAIQAQFDVTVTNVNVMIAKGKTKLAYRKGSRPSIGKRNDVRKAYVTLKEGDRLPIFAAVEKAEADVKKAEEKATKATKKSEEKK